MIVEKLDALHAVASALNVDDLATLTMRSLCTARFRTVSSRSCPVRLTDSRTRGRETGALRAATRDFHHTERTTGSHRSDGLKPARKPDSLRTDIDPTPNCRSVAAVALARSGGTHEFRSGWASVIGRESLIGNTHCSVVSELCH